MIVESDRPAFSDIREARYTHIDDKEKDTLRKEFDTLFEKVGREDLKQTIQWDIAFNRDDIPDMLRKLSTFKPENGEVSPLDLAIVLLTSAGADLEGFKINNPEKPSKEKKDKIENPFKNELLKIENVWQNIRRTREKIVNERGETETKEYLITEFRLKDVFHIDATDTPLTQREQFLAMAAEQYLRMRYQWDSNVFQDKKYLVVKELNQVEAHAVDAVLEDLNLDKDLQYSEVGISKAHMLKKVAFNRTKYRSEIKSLQHPEHVTSLNEVVSGLGIDTMLTHDSIAVDAHHGWCGDPEAMMGILTQAMYKANRTIHEPGYSGHYKNVVGIMSENLGVVTIPDKKQLHKQLIDRLANHFGKVQNPNLSSGFFKNFRFQPGPGRAAFDPETYGRDMEWTANHVFGLLGEKDGKSVKNIWIGWSYGGAGTEEFGGRVGKRLEQNWKEHAPKLFQKWNDEYKEYIDLYHHGYQDKSVIAKLTELYNNLTKLHIAGLQYLPEYSIWQDVGAPDLILLPQASAVNGTTDFLGPGRNDAYLKQFGEYSASAASGLTVNTGITLHKSRLTRYRLGRWALQGVAGLYTKMVLFTGTIKPEEKEELNKIGKRHQLNYASPINGQEVVPLQSTGLVDYPGKSEDCARYLRSQHLFILHAIGTGDFLVNFKKWSDAEAKASVDMLTTVDDFGHSIVAKKEHKERIPIDLYIKASKNELYLFREQLKKLARLKTGFKEVNGVKNDFINAEDDELVNRFNEDRWDQSMATLGEQNTLERRQIYQDTQLIFANDPRWGQRALQIMNAHEPHLFIPRELRADDNRGALMRLERVREQIGKGIIGTVLSIV